MAALRRAELAETVNSSDVSDTSGAVGIDWPAVLERAAERGGERWSQWSDGHGAHRAASALEAAARGRRLAAHTAVVTLVHGRHDHLRGLIAGLARGTHLPERLVVVAMDDPEVGSVCADASTGTGLAVEVIAVEGTPEGLPLAHARNRGADRAAELGCDVLVFLDVDCIPGPDLVACYADHVRASTQAQDAVDGDDGDQDCGAPPTVWSGPVTYLPPAPDDGYDLVRLADLADPHPARPAPAAGQVVPAEDLDLFWSLSFALSRRDFVRIGGFCEEYVGYGGEDTDFAMRLRDRDGRLFWLGAPTPSISTTRRSGRRWRI
ncbi:glycosyltransferase family 2 protein [Mobilicoccus caccae]|uniref:Galactosyltransferase C-terminal domain-containing protein n=1 Tax=Mobilicoccus caccae TaxID=1859295 RepID=A0ABQ6IPF7_9MICO|nr:galactosyltransferase-related protein [Mobilicoccus caccae]GMA39210.1 hypothetical protein GCM10025883_12550 [Mobilicoccus caccae]